MDEAPELRKQVTVPDLLKAVTIEHQIPPDPRAYICLVFIIFYTYTPDVFALLIALSPDIFTNIGLSSCDDNDRDNDMKLQLYIGGGSFIGLSLIAVIMRRLSHFVAKSRLFDKTSGKQECQGCGIYASLSIIGAVLIFWMYWIVRGFVLYIALDNDCKESSLASIMLAWSCIKILPVLIACCVSCASISPSYNERDDGLD